MTKKVIAAICAMLIAGCGTSAGTPTTPSPETNMPEPEVVVSPEMPNVSSEEITKFRKVSEIYELNANQLERGNTEDTFFIVFEKDGIQYRAYADITQEVFDEIMALDFENPEYESKYRIATGNLDIRQIDNLTEMIPLQEELDQWVGKTGKDLHDAGWQEGYGYNLEEMDFFLNYGPFSFMVQFEKDKEYENSDDFDVWTTIEPLTVVNVTYDGVGNGAEIN